MIIYSKVTTQPTAEPISLAEVRIQCKIDPDDTSEDSYLTRQISVARNIGQRYCGLSFLTQTRTLILDYFPCGVLRLPDGPVQSVTSISYVKTDETIGTLVLNTDFRLSEGRIQAIDSWPSTNSQIGAVTIVYVTGYTNTGQDLIPDVIPEAMLKTVARIYEHKGDTPDGFAVLTDEIMDLYDSVKVYHSAEY